MKSTRLKISVSQDGLLPQETEEIATLSFPVLPKKLLRALGFERVDSDTFVGVLPVFVSLGDKEQEIEIELGVALPEMRKKVIEIIQTTVVSIDEASDGKQRTKSKKSTAKSSKSKSGKSKSKKSKSGSKKGK